MKRLAILITLLAAGTVFASSGQSGLLSNSYLYPWVDGLNVRAAPNPSMPAVAKLNVGDRVTYLGVSSTNKATYTLRGRQITGYFIKVGLEDGKEGWVFSGALLPYFAERYKTTVTVGSNGDYLRLQDAIDAAKPGTVIRLTDKEYDFYQAIRIVNKTNIVIDGGGASLCLREDNDYIFIEVKNSSYVTIVNSFFDTMCDLDVYRKLEVMDPYSRDTMYDLDVYRELEVMDPYSRMASIYASSFVLIAGCSFEFYGVPGIDFSDCTNVLFIGNFFSEHTGNQIGIGWNVSALSICSNDFVQSGCAISLWNHDRSEENFDTDADVNRAAAVGSCWMRNNRYRFEQSRFEEGG